MNTKNLNIIKQFESADKEEFKRPDHPDFLSSLELKQQKWSGIRSNSITQELEIWALGELRGSMPELVAQNFPERWEALYAEVFALHHVESNPQKGN